MTKSPRKNVPDVGIELGAACMPSELASDRATAPGYISSFYTWNFKPLASFGGCAGRFESYLVENPKDRFSDDVAHLMCPIF